MAKVGRPPALTPYNQEKFCNLILLGCGWETAAAGIGCRPRTVRREANRNPEFEKKWRDAELSVVGMPLKTIYQAMQQNWRPALWFVERVYSSRFGKQHPRYISMEQLQAAANEWVAEVTHAISDKKTRTRVRKKLDKMTKLWDKNWRPGHTLNKKRPTLSGRPPNWLEPGKRWKDESEATQSVPASQTADPSDVACPSATAENHVAAESGLAERLPTAKPSVTEKTAPQSEVEVLAEGAAQRDEVRSPDPATAGGKPLSSGSV